MKGMFKNSKFNQPLQLDLSSIGNMEEMFENSQFNKDISYMEITEGTNINNMFNNSATIEANKPIKIDIDISEHIIQLPKTIKKSITIFIKLHGGNYPEIPLPKNIVNTVLAGPTSFCGISDDQETVHDMLEIIKGYQDIYDRKKISEANILFAPLFKKKWNCLQHLNGLMHFIGLIKILH
jgi:hypothetical protein